VCSLAIGDEFRAQLSLCIQSQEIHAAKHGYDRITDESVYDPSRPHSWSKIRLIQKYLPLYDYVMWLDGDVLITNHERRIEEFIALMDPTTMFFAGIDLNGLNAGVFIIRNCPDAFDFLADTYAKTEYTHSCFWEQAAIDELRKLPKYVNYVKLIPHKFVSIMNAYDYSIDPTVHWKPGDFCIHFAGFREKGDCARHQHMYSLFASTDPSGTMRIQEYLHFENHKQAPPASLGHERIAVE
jgi:hypothetical protein